MSPFCLSSGWIVAHSGRGYASAKTTDVVIHGALREPQLSGNLVLAPALDVRKAGGLGCLAHGKSLACHCLAPNGSHGGVMLTVSARTQRDTLIGIE